MARVVLTEKAVEKEQPAPEGSRTNIWDALVPSLALRVTDKGHKSWIVQRRVNGQMLRVTLGEYPVLGVADAREKARAAVEDLSRGKDPRQRARVTPTALRADSFKGAAEAFIARAVAKDRRERTAEEITRYLRSEFVARWGSQPLNGVTKADVQDAIDEIAATKPIAANRARNALSVFFDWAVDRNLAETNLAKSVRKPSKESPRSRVLTDDEIREFWSGASALGWPFSQFFRALLVSGQRRGEIAGMTKHELDRDHATWTIPASRSKNRREHLVHLSPLLGKIIDEAIVLKPVADEDPSPAIGHNKGPALDEIADPEGHIFSTNDSTAISGFSRAKLRLDGLILQARADSAIKAGQDPKKVRPPPLWTLHDLRRTAATGMARLGTHPHVIESALNHVSGFRSGVGGIYQRHDYLNERRAAFDRWSEHLLELLEPQPKQRRKSRDNVIKLRR